MTTSAEPFIHVRAKPPNGPAPELVLLRESADKRKGGDEPPMTAGQPRYVVRGEDLIPRRESFVDPAGERHVRGHS